MKPQIDLSGPVDDGADLHPDGFRYQSNVNTRKTEHALLGKLRELPLKAFEFHGYTGKRRTVSYGGYCDFASERLIHAAHVPPFLHGLRTTVAAFARRAPALLQQALIAGNGPAAGIGWHRD